MQPLTIRDRKALWPSFSTSFIRVIRASEPSGLSHAHSRLGTLCTRCSVLHKNALHAFSIALHTCQNILQISGKSLISTGLTVHQFFMSCLRWIVSERRLLCTTAVVEKHFQYIQQYKRLLLQPQNAQTTVQHHIRAQLQHAAQNKTALVF